MVQRLSVREDLLSASFGLQLALTHLVKSSRSFSLPLMQSMSVSWHVDDEIIVRVQSNYMTEISMESRVLTWYTYRAWRQILNRRRKHIVSALTLRKRQRRKDKAQ